ncbi:hypothetical protein [Shewanella sp. GutCb]|uniref:hypothetical protein n=1 Tax=Shewanella sp. GutCb TaxID=2058315 RepID=UPI00215518D1|nr:hypothetical protein [Shewanella sp. GutCb]
MSSQRFGALPNWWFRDDSLFTNLRGNKTGEGIAAMKCLLALSVLIDFKTKSVEASLSDLESITGLSRPMVIKGLYTLEKFNVISADKDSYKNKYTILVKPEDQKWAKVPTDMTRKKLKEISNRGIAPFVALKIYITMLSLRFGDKIRVKLSHETIRNYTKIQPKQVRAGLDVLFSCSLIHLQPRDEQTSNEYILIGVSAG